MIFLRLALKVNLFLFFFKMSLTGHFGYHIIKTTKEELDGNIKS